MEIKFWRCYSTFFGVYALACGLLGGQAIGVLITVIFFGVLYHRCLPQPNIQSIENNKMFSLEATHVIAHKGGSCDAPENTLAAIRQARKNGAKAVEFDLEYTSDGIPILFHDDTVERTTNGSGEIKNLTYDYIKTLSASAKHHKSAEFPDEKIPTLEEAVQLCLELGLFMFIDVKGGSKKSAEVLDAMYRKYPAMYNEAIVCSFNPAVVYRVRAANSRIMGALTHRLNYLSSESDGTPYNNQPYWQRTIAPFLDIILYWSHRQWLWYLCGSSAFLVHKGDVNEAEVRHFAERGVRVVVWTVNNELERRFLQERLRVPVISDTMSPEGCQD